METNCFSISQIEDWSKGLFVNTGIREKRVALTTEKVYKVLKRCKLQNDDCSYFSALTALNSLIFINKNTTFLLYDWLADKNEVLFTFNHSSNNQLLQVVKEKVFFYEAGTKGTIRAYSVHTGKEVLTKTLEEWGQLKALYITQDFILYAIDSTGQFKKWDLKSEESHKLFVFKDIDQNGFVDLQVHQNQTYVLINKCLYGFDDQMRQIHEIKDVENFRVYKTLLYYTQQQDGQTYIYGKGRILFSLPEYVCKIEVDKAERLYIQTNDELMIYQEKRINRKGNQNKPFTGIYYLPLLDSGQEETQWARIMVDAEIPSGTQINVSYYAFDHKRVNDIETPELQSFFYKTKLKALERCKVLNQFMGSEWVNPKEALFQEAKGRYLLVRIVLWGNENVTPLINRIRITFNEDSFVNYLPEIYQTGEGRDFIERFLRIYETLYKELEERIDGLSDHIDIEWADDSILRWLTSWFGFEVDETWNTDKIRNLLVFLPEYNRKRGTKKALQKLLKIYLGKQPLIIENYKKKMNNSQQETVLDPYGFTIIVKLDKALTDAEKITINRLLDSETPAHTHYRFVELNDWIALDKESYLGLNSFVSDTLMLNLDNRGVLPYHTLLDDDEQLK